MFIRGLSTHGVGGVWAQLTGVNPSASTVSRVFHTLEAEYDTWKQRPLASHYLYAFADGAYFSIIYEAEGCQMPIRAVIGITEAGESSVTSFL